MWTAIVEVLGEISELAAAKNILKGIPVYTGLPALLLIVLLPVLRLKLSYIRHQLIEKMVNLKALLLLQKKGVMSLNEAIST